MYLDVGVDSSMKIVLESFYDSYNDFVIGSASAEYIFFWKIYVKITAIIYCGIIFIYVAIFVRFDFYFNFLNLLT